MGETGFITPERLTAYTETFAQVMCRHMASGHEGKHKFDIPIAFETVTMAKLCEAIFSGYEEGHPFGVGFLVLPEFADMLLKDVALNTFRNFLMSNHMTLVVQHGTEPCEVEGMRYFQMALNVGFTVGITMGG